MKHIHTFESFLNESSDLNEWRKPKVEDLVHNMKVKIARGRFAGSIGVIHDFQLTDGGNLVDDQVDILLDKPGKPFAYLGLDDILIESINESKETVNEDVGLIADVAIGVASGLAGLWALVKGSRAVGRFLGNTAEVLANKLEAKARQAAKNQRKELVGEIVKKFDGDKELERMYQNLPKYSPNAKTKAMIAQNKERTKQLRVIGNYIKGKLTPEEMAYFTEISSMLRTGDIN